MTSAMRVVLSPRGWILLAAAFAFVTIQPEPARATDAEVQAPLQIWFVRHAESELNVATLPHPVADAGISYPLTKRGVEQAAAFADAYAHTPIVAIYTSTLLRAIQTSDALAFTHRIPLTLAPEAVEINIGVDPDAADFGMVYQGLRHRWMVERDLEARYGEGESLADAQRRFLPFVREVMNRHAHDRGVVIVMAHGATLGFLVPMLATNVPADFALRRPLTNTGIIKTELKDNSLVCTEWVGVSSNQFNAANL
jgi:2,3-bisphosphoglycerate-dependent phosphoglycerate mutase